jgi:hypothetical protein
MIGVHEDIKIEITGAEEIYDGKLDAGTYERQTKRYLRRLIRDPDDIETRAQLAYIYALMHREDLAEIEFEKNYAIDPDDERTSYVKSLVEFQRGNYRAAWPLMELRYKMPAREQWGDREHPVPRWHGEPTEQTVLVSSEQGFGDSIMFARFWPLVLERAPNAILEVQPQLYELFQQSGFNPLYRKDRTLPKYRKWCSLPSVPSIFNLGIEQIGMEKPYLMADPILTEKWKKTFPKDARVGLCWKGSAASERGFTRDMGIELFEPLTKLFDFVSLTNVGQFESFAATAACIAALDLVITVDTSVAHLAGAMGKPVWLLATLDCDWRWLRDRTDTPWYPSMRIFQQKELANWEPVISTVVKELQDLI